MAIIIAGERSGVGKTTVTLALLAAMKARSRSAKSPVQSFKVGPDYIDPMFHSYITGLPCRNLDPVLTSESYVKSCFTKHSQNTEYALIEGVMGLFDGATGKDDTASTAHIARLLNIPVILILNCASTSRSIAAIAHGYRTFDPRIHIAGVVSPMGRWGEEILLPSPHGRGAGGEGLRIAIAQDRAFSFYYADNLDLFREMGAELIPWSPISDRALPENIQGLYFGGGFPEVFASELAENKTARESVHNAIKSGMPTYAECGGLMYLCDRIVDFQEQSFPMVNIFPTAAKMGKRLTLGYRQAIALQDSPLMKKGDRIWGHEFHRSSLTEICDQPLYSLQGYDSHLQYLSEGWQKYQVHAAYTHLHFGEQTHLLDSFLSRCRHSC